MIFTYVLLAKCLFTDAKLHIFFRLSKIIYNICMYFN